MKSSPIIKKSSEPHSTSELGEPFAVEVIYNGDSVARLSDREFTDMFWRRYTITPNTEAEKAIIESDDLWDSGAFDYRDPASGKVCTTGFVGGSPPFVTDGKIYLRALYFDSND